MATVPAFGTIPGTENAGMTAYFRSSGCTYVDISDVLPILTKIDYYEDEYIIGQMKIWDVGYEHSLAQCVMVRVIVYADGWICAWFDKETQNQGAASTCGYVNSTTLSGFGSIIQYTKQWNGCILRITNSNGVDPSDPECPDGTEFTIKEANATTHEITVQLFGNYGGYNFYHFNTGNTYDCEIYMINANLSWPGTYYTGYTQPPYMSNMLYRAIYEMWEELKWESDASVTELDSVTKGFRYNGPGLGYSDYTTHINSTATSDTRVMDDPEVLDSAFHYGYPHKFIGLDIQPGLLGVGSAITWEYYNGTDWVALSVTDGTLGYTASGYQSVTFVAPGDWETTNVNGYEYYWIRTRVTATNFTTSPRLTQGWIRSVKSVEYTDPELGMYSFEDPTALYCLICGGVYAGSAYTWYFYNTCLPGKNIYSHSIRSSLYGSYAMKCYVNYNWVLSFYGTGGTLFVMNIEDIDNPSGTQNVFSVNSSRYSNTLKLASIMITD